MGKSIRPRRPSSSEHQSKEMRRHRVGSSSSVGDGGSCRGSTLLLCLLVAFLLAFFTIFGFTFRGDRQYEGSAFSRSRAARVAVERGTQMEDAEGELEDTSVGVYGYEVVQEYDHDPRAFTQGLAYAGNGTLYESTGIYQQSTVREVDLMTGKVRRKHRMKDQDFGEGLTVWKDRLLQVTWRTNIGYIYDRKTLHRLGGFSHHMKDGWGLTATSEYIVGSDGTSKLYFMNPDTFEDIKVVTVKDEDKEVGWLNELEFVNNEIWANVWQGNCIARISPQDGKVTGWILLHGLKNGLLAEGVKGMDVLNGIAWDSENDRIYVTGKWWPKLYEIKLLERTHNANGSLEAVRALCNIGREGFRR